MSAHASDPHSAAPLDLDREEDIAALPLRAQELLAAENLEAYSALLTQVQGIESPHRRYWASVRLLECALAAVATYSRRDLPALYATLATGALDALEREPREPVLLNYTGVALYELWGLSAASALFAAAQRLDPELPQVTRNLAAARNRERERSRSAAREVHGWAPLHPALPILERRAHELTARAQPAEGLRLSLCMIVRDEQEMLPRCLAAVVDVVDEIVLVDTGSTDASIEIARSYGARVIERPWDGSFAQARNVGLDAATGDWLLVLDADEVLVREDVPLLRSLTARTWREAFYLAEINHTGDLEAGAAVTHDTLRLFRNRPSYRYRGRLHEQFAHALPGYLPERLQVSGVRIEHYGYLGAVRDNRAKSERNIELLRLQQQEAPPSAFLHFNLGSEYAAAGDPHAALPELQRAWALLEQDPEADSYHFTPALASRLVGASRVCGHLQEAITVATLALQRFPGFTDLVIEQASASLQAGETERAIELYERCIEMGDAPSRYTATVGCGTYLPRLALAELHLERGETQRAAELCEYCLREHPQFTGVVLPYAAALLAGGASPAEVVDAVEDHLPDPSAAARFMLGTALCECGAAGAAEVQFRAVLQRQPHSARAHVALAEVLLAQRRYAEAAQIAAALPSEDPLAAVAARSELFARLAGREQATVEEALQRARTAGMPTAELELFGAWHELTSSGSTAVQLPATAVALLERILRALLRVQDFGLFESLLPLLERTPLSQRDRRELLAQAYLDRGFLASAAEEWLAVCREQPDVPALLGLARVAERQGLGTEAIDFAQALLALDPENCPALQLLARTRASESAASELQVA
ncbi:MAG TPA: glycosyltransferase [Solirubrobacteraceae bacterium]|jgi:tetratricopeptide (TPR) repeat protein